VTSTDWNRREPLFVILLYEYEYETTAHDVHDGRMGGSMGELGGLSSTYSTVRFNSAVVYILLVAAVVVYAN